MPHHNEDEKSKPAPVRRKTPKEKLSELPSDLGVFSLVDDWNHLTNQGHTHFRRIRLWVCSKAIKEPEGQSLEGRMLKYSVNDIQELPNNKGYQLVQAKLLTKTEQKKVEKYRADKKGKAS